MDTQKLISELNKPRKEGIRFGATFFNNIKELERIDYVIENIDNRVFRIKNSYGDVVASIFVKSGFIEIPKGKIFNYKKEVQEGIKVFGSNEFFNLK